MEGFIYLGGIICKDNRVQKDIKARLGKFQGGLSQLLSTWRSKQYRLEIKVYRYNSNIKSVLLYGGSEDW